MSMIFTNLRCGTIDKQKGDKMRKRLLFVPLLMTVACFSSCRPVLSEKTVEDINNNSNFEIDLLTKVEEGDFEGFGVIPGHGVTGYYDKKYWDMDADYDAVYACYVRYDVTAYPDVALGEPYVTGIFITDPEIHLYGYTVGGSSEEFSDILGDKGFEEYYNNGHLMKFSKGKVEIRCGINHETQEINSLYVGMDLSNMLGVMF